MALAPNLVQHKYDVQKPRWIFCGVVKHNEMIYHGGSEKYNFEAQKKTNLGSISIVLLNNLPVPSLSPMSHGGRTEMAQWRELSPPTNVARFRFRPDVG